MSTRTGRTTEDKLAVFRACFSGLTDVYGTYDPRTGRARQVKAPVTDEVLLRHLKGEQPYGVYLLTGERTRAVVVDFDEEDTGPPLEFVQRARHYGLTAYLERSKSKGWHAWVFVDLPSVPAAKGRAVVKTILADIEHPHVEVFPKQDRLAGGTCYGNFINAPLFGGLVPEGRTVFVDVARGFEPYADQWALLTSVRRVTEADLDAIIEINDLAVEDSPCRPRLSGTEGGQWPIGLPPCAQRMLAQGVRENQRVACFRLAVGLKKAGLPEDVAVAGLLVWARKNRPRNGKQTITRSEIEAQTRSAYGADYRACGCEDPAVSPYCEPTCPLRGEGV